MYYFKKCFQILHLIKYPLRFLFQRSPCNSFNLDSLVSGYAEQYWIGCPIFLFPEVFTLLSISYVSTFFFLILSGLSSIFPRKNGYAIGKLSKSLPILKCLLLGVPGWLCSWASDSSFQLGSWIMILARVLISSPTLGPALSGESAWRFFLLSLSPSPHARTCKNAVSLSLK